MKWTSRFMRLTAAAALSGVCWMWLGGIGVSQETTPPDPSQGSGTTPRTNQYGSTQQGYGQQGYGQSSANQYGRSQSGNWNQPGAISGQSRDMNRQGRDQWQDLRDQSRDAIGQARDDMRDTTRGARDQFQNTRDQSRDTFRDSREDFRDNARTDRDDFRDQTQRDFSREGQRDQFQRDRDQSRDQFSDQRDQFRDQRDQFRDQRDQFDRRDQFSDQRDQFTDRRGQFSDRRDQFQDSRNQFQDNRGQFQDNRNVPDARSDQFQGGRSDQFQSGRFDQRGMRQDFQGQGRQSANLGASGMASASSRTQINRAADLGLWFNRNVSNGLVISDVATSGPITRFGFREGDQILSVNGTRVVSEQQFLNYLLSPQLMNQRVQVLVWRNGQQVPVWVEPWTLVQSQSSGYAQTDALEPVGIVLDDRYQLPVVWKVLPQSPAHYAGIRGNDVIVAWNGQHVDNPQELESLVEQTQANEIPVQISRNRQLRQVTLELDGQSRTALRPNYDQGYETSDAIGTQAIDTYNAPAAQSGTFYQQRTFTQPGATYIQPGTTYVQPGFVQPGTTYVTPGGTYVQPRPGILPRLRGR